jgi:hypothetical protein
VVVEFLDLPTHYGLVLFGGHSCILLSDPLQLEGSSFSTTSMIPLSESRHMSSELRRTPLPRTPVNKRGMAAEGGREARSVWLGPDRGT